MILLTRLGGQPLALNPDLIEKAEATPDTVITMVDGHKLVVAESVDDVVSRIRRWRASVAAEAFTLSAGGPVAPVAPVVHERDRPQDDVAATSGPPQLARVLRLSAREE